MSSWAGVSLARAIFPTPATRCRRTACSYVVHARLPEAGSILVQPSSQELGDRLPFIRQRRPLLHVPEDPCELVSDLPARPTVDRFPAPLTFLPSEIHPSDPSAIGTLSDAALSPAASACIHFVLSPFDWSTVLDGAEPPWTASARRAGRA